MHPTMKILLFDTPFRKKLFPLTLTRATADIRIGIVKLRERWERVTGLNSVVLTEAYLQDVYGQLTAGDYLMVDSSVMPTPEIVERLQGLNEGEALADKVALIGGRINLERIPAFGDKLSELFERTSNVDVVRRLELPCEIFQWNEEMINEDFQQLTKGRVSNNNVETVHITNASNVFIEESAIVDYSSLNATNGPIYIGANAHVMEGCLIRGPFVLSEGAVLKMGTKIYGATTIGPYCVAGGEIKNSVMLGYSNKSHDGYLGDSVIGEWCNLGAGTSNSNVKNNAGEIKVYNYFTNTYISTGTKCGMIMGDFSRSSINTSFTTGTVVGICCNVFGEGLTPKFIPDFTWGTKGLSRYEFKRALKDAINWMKMKNIVLEDSRMKVLKHIFDHYND